MTQIDVEPPSKDQLAKTTAIAAIIAVVVLVVAVLPAEYGIDPTGIGGAIGLSADPDGADDAGRGYDGPGEPYQAESVDPQTITVDIRLPEGGRWFEWKFAMDIGDTLVFNWTADTSVRSDLHGEPYNETLGTASFRDETMQGDQGSYRAAFEGRHGWAWRHEGDEPVTITLTVTGHWNRYLPIGTGEASVRGVGVIEG